MASKNTPIQITGAPGESSAIHGIKRSRGAVSESGDTSEPETIVKHYGPKRQRLASEIEGTLELRELYSVVDDINSEDVPKPVVDDAPSEEDVEFMKKAQDVSMKSPDESTKVGAIVVDSKNNAILGEGWNRMPAGCEDRFTWSKGDNDVLKTKYPYVEHGVMAAILDALVKHGGGPVKGATLFSTLLPDHNDSKMIRHVGITRVVFRDDKYPQHAFTIASKKILQGLDWRQIKIPAEEPKHT